MEKKYGVSSKFNFGKWEHVVYIFENQSDAEEWLNSEEHDFREREIMTQEEALALADKEAVDEAINYDEVKAMREYRI